jgi:hypothetical protein
MNTQWEETIGKTPLQIAEIIRKYPFSKQLLYHMEFGTRPGGRPGVIGKEWFIPELAGKLQRDSSEKSISLWLNDKHFPDPANRRSLHDAFFGANNEYAPLAAAFRFSIASKAKAESPFLTDPVPEKIKVKKLRTIEDQVSSTGWRLDSLQKGQALTHPQFNSELVKGNLNIKLVVSSQKWTEHDKRSALLKYIRDISVGDTNPGRKIRVAGEIVGQASVVVQETNYFDSLVTDQRAWQMVRSRAVDHQGRPQQVLHDGLSDFLTDQGELLDYNRNKLSNQLGASTLAFTRDGALLIVYQNDLNSQSAETLAPSGSGSLDWEDIPSTGGDLIQIAKSGAERELREECRLDSGSDRRQEYRHIDCALLPFAFAKMLHRGSKPEFYFVSAIHAEYDEVINRRPADKYVAKVIMAPVAIANWTASRPSIEIRDLCKSYLKGLEYNGRNVVPSYPLEHSLELLVEECSKDDTALVIDEFFRKEFAG